jgi:hypothetical protein
MAMADLPDTDPPNPAVLAVFERAGKLTVDEVQQLNAAVRRGLDLEALARLVLDNHQRYLNNWAMFDHWSHPWDEMVEARVRVATVLGAAPAIRPSALEPDDGSVIWGAATAAAYAVLACGAARAEPRFRAPWDLVLGVEVEDS